MLGNSHAGLIRPSRRTGCRRHIRRIAAQIQAIDDVYVTSLPSRRHSPRVRHILLRTDRVGDQCPQHCVSTRTRYFAAAIIRSSLNRLDARLGGGIVIVTCGSMENKARSRSSRHSRCLDWRRSCHGHLSHVGHRLDPVAIVRMI